MSIPNARPAAAPQAAAAAPDVSRALTAPLAATDPLAALSSAFDAPEALAGWHEHAPPGFAPKWRPPRVEGGYLVLEPYASGWFEDNHAGHLYRPVDGDFVVTTHLRVRGTRSALPQTEFSLAGLLVRAPHATSAATWVPGRESWLFFSVGSASPAGTPQYEVKTTTGSCSTLKILPAQAGWVDLRVARHGELFTLLDRPAGAAAWRVVDQLVRPDLPAHLHVGLTAYADWGSVAPIYPDYHRYNTAGVGPGAADLLADVAWIRFRRPRTPRFPIANLDAPATFGRDVLAARRADLLGDQ